jgi:hypothetical protein
MGDVEGRSSRGDGRSIRLGDPERKAAKSALDVHREAGRLSSQEFEDRSLRAGQARLWSDLDPLFADLPEPRPQPPAMPPSTAAADVDGSDGLIPDRWASTIVALSPFLALALFFTTRSWLWFLLIPAISVLAYGGRKK